jgi:hypothetical protein
MGRGGREPVTANLVKLNKRKENMKKLLIATAAVLTLLTGTAHAGDDHPEVGKRGTIKNMDPACRTIEGLDKLRRAARIDDQEAYTKLRLRGVASGECITLRQGQIVNVVDSSLWHSALCVSPQGEPDCWWIIQSEVAK